MNTKTPLLASQRVVQICLFLASAICLFGGVLQMYKGDPESSPQVDNVHRFLGGVYFGTGFIGIWTLATIRRQGTLVFLLALTILCGATGRLMSMSQVGLPEPHALWLTYLLSELIIPCIMIVAHVITNRKAAAMPPEAETSPKRQ